MVFARNKSINLAVFSGAHNFKVLTTLCGESAESTIKYLK
jgi:hypothetical protein